MHQLSMTPSHWQQMLSHVQACVPMEACGLLAGTGDAVKEVYLIENREHSRFRFRMEAAEQLGAFRAMEDRGLELLGIFHSHPADPDAGSASSERPSPTDVLEAAYPVVHVIWSRPRGQWLARGFWIEDGQVSEIPLRVSAHA